MNGCRHLRPEVLTAVALLLVAGVGAAESQVSAAGLAARRNVTSRFSEAITAGLPKYHPSEEIETVEVSESSAPAEEKNGVLALPTMRVRPVMKESPSDHAFLTAKGRNELAMKSYPGLRIGNIFGLNQKVALAMQAEEEHVRKTADLKDRFERSTLEDSADNRETLRLLKAALQRPNAEWLNGR